MHDDVYRLMIGNDRWHLWAWGWCGWWLRLGPLMLGLRSHRHHRPLFGERYRTHPRRWYFHLGHLCLVIEWRPNATATPNGAPS